MMHIQVRMILETSTLLDTVAAMSLTLVFNAAVMICMPGIPKPCLTTLCCRIYTRIWGSAALHPMSFPAVF